MPLRIRDARVVIEPWSWPALWETEGTANARAAASGVRR